MSTPGFQKVGWNAQVGSARFQPPVKSQSTMVQTGLRNATIPAQFQHLLEQEIDQSKTASGIQFSKHANLRMQQRGLALDETQIQQLDQAVDKAAAKGARDALVLMNDQAFIVNIKQRTVITAMDANELQDHVVTQIDSAVIVPATRK